MKIKKIAFITGATSGIGEATAQLFAQHNIQLILCGRNEKKLAELEAHLPTEVMTLAFDVTNKKAVQEAISSLPDAWKNIDILVNSAGNAFGLEPIQQGNSENWDKMIDLNIKGLLYVSEMIIPIMVAQNQGHIINLGSVAGMAVYPKGNIYCATKYAVNAISDAMRIDLNAHNIKVTEIRPGAVETNFSITRFNGDTERAKKVYEGFTPLKAQDVAETIWFSVQRPAHVQIAEIVIYPTAQASGTIFNRK